MTGQPWAHHLSEQGSAWIRVVSAPLYLPVAPGMWGGRVWMPFVQMEQDSAHFLSACDTTGPEASLVISPKQLCDLTI